MGNTRVEQKIYPYSTHKKASCKPRLFLYYFMRWVLIHSSTSVSENLFIRFPQTNGLGKEGSSFKILRSVGAEQPIILLTSVEEIILAELVGVSLSIKSDTHLRSSSLFLIILFIILLFSKTSGDAKVTVLSRFPVSAFVSDGSFLVNTLQTNEGVNVS